VNFPKQLTVEEPYEFERVFERAVREILALEDEGSEFHCVSAQGAALKSSINARRKRLAQYHKFIEPRSIGLFLGEYFGDLDCLGHSVTHHVHLAFDRAKVHALSREKFSYARQCAEKYMPVVVALKALDAAITGYFYQLKTSFADIGETFFVGSEYDSIAHKDAKERLLQLASLTSNFHALSSELAPFYVMEMERQGVVDFFDVDAHYAVLNAILRCEPLSVTFLSSAKNDFGKCPFHAINQVFSLDFDVADNSDVSLKDTPRRGALLPFVMGRIYAATGRRPEVKFMSGLTEMRAGLE